MGKRMMDRSLWDEEWFLDLPDNYKLLYLYMKSKCDGCGIWRVNRRLFSLVSKFPSYLDDFVSACNKDDSGEEGGARRVVMLDKHKLWLPGFISEEYGHEYRGAIGAHRGMLRLLVSNKIPLEEVPDFDFKNLYSVDKEQLSEIAYGRGKHTPHIPHTNPTHTPREREMEMEREREINSNKGVHENSGTEGGEDLPEGQQIYGDPPPNQPPGFDWEFQKEAVRQDREWIMQMMNKYQLSEEDMATRLEQFFEMLADNSDKKTARLMTRHFNYWHPKQLKAVLIEKEQSKSNKKTDNKNLSGKQDYQNQQSW